MEIKDKVVKYKIELFNVLNMCNFFEQKKYKEY